MVDEVVWIFIHIRTNPRYYKLLADYLSRWNFENNQETLTTNSKLILEKHVLLIVNDFSVNKTSHTVNCLISGNVNKKDLLLVSNETFVAEQTKDPELSPIYKEIVNKGSASKFHTSWLKNSHVQKRKRNKQHFFHTL